MLFYGGEYVEPENACNDRRIEELCDGLARFEDQVLHACSVFKSSFPEKSIEPARSTGLPLVEHFF